MARVAALESNTAPVAAASYISVEPYNNPTAKMTVSAPAVDTTASQINALQRSIENSLDTFGSKFNERLARLELANAESISAEEADKMITFEAAAVSSLISGNWRYDALGNIVTEYPQAIPSETEIHSKARELSAAGLKFMYDVDNDGWVKITTL